MMKKSEYSKFCREVSAEHYQFTKGVDGNMNYLWYLYSEGTKAGDVARFMFFAETNLNQTMGLIDSEEKDRLYSLLESPIEGDDFYIGFLALKHLRHERHKKFGAHTNAPAYDPIKSNYAFSVLSHELFVKIARR